MCASRGGEWLIGSRHEEQPQRMLGKGRQPAGYQVRDKKGATGRRYSVLQAGQGYRDRQQGQNTFLAVERTVPEDQGRWLLKCEKQPPTGLLERMI